MNALMNVNQVLTMSSREIADITGKEHAHVMRDIRALTAALEQNPELVFVCKTTFYEGSNGQAYRMYELDKDACLTLLLGYDAVARMKVVKRWQELEAAAVQPQGFVIPKSMSEALRLAADLSEQNERLSIELDTAVRTKAEIGSRREATAMATASAKAKEVAKLQHELGRNQQHATVIAVEKATDRKFGKSGFVPLRRVTKKYGLTAVDVMDPRWGTAKAWPAIAWREAYGIELGDLFDASEAA